MGDGGGGWREKWHAGEGKSDQIETKMRNWSYLRERGNKAQLTGASALRIALENEGFAGGGENELERTGKERGRRSVWVL